MNSAALGSTFGMNNPPRPLSSHSHGEIPAEPIVAAKKFASLQPRSAYFACQSMQGRHSKVYKELGLFSLKKKIEDAVSRAEMIAPALEVEEARRIKQEQVLREYNLWDDLARSNESLTALTDAIKLVNDLKDTQHKAEEAKLITELAEMDSIDHNLFKQAYKASLDVSRFLDRYEISKLLKGPYDMEGACMIIRAGAEDIHSKLWAEKLLNMYMRWADKQGYKGRVIELYSFEGGGIREATLEFESKYFYGYLSGEKGTHRMVRTSLDESIIREAYSVEVDVIPLFMGKAIDLHIDDKDLEISCPSQRAERSGNRMDSVVIVHHIPSGEIFQCSGERSHFANKFKALNRLKGKLLVLAAEQGLPHIEKMKRDDTPKFWEHETRVYTFRPQKSVYDLKTGIRLSGLNSVLDGNIEPLILAHIKLKQGRYMG